MSNWLGAGRGHWTLLGAISVLAFVMIGTCAITVGLLLDPLMREFRWSNSAVSSLATVYSLSCMLGSPFIGWIVDKYGSKRAMLAGVAITAAGFSLIAVSNVLPVFYVAFVLIGVGYGGAFYLGMWTLIAERMGSQKNLGMGVLSGVGSIGAAVFSVVAGRTIAAFDWRTAAAAAACIVIAMLPIVLLLIPAKRAGNAEEATLTVAQPREARPVGMMLSPYYVLAVIMSALAAFGMSSIFFHVVPIMMNAGLSQDRASEVLGATWLVSGIGSLCIGIIANRTGASAALAGAMLLSATGTLFLLLIGAGSFSTAAIWIFILLWGATANSINQFLPILFVERFGALHLGLLLGVQSAFMGVIGSAAPIATGALYDHYNNYSAAVLMSISVTCAAFVFAMGLAFGMRRRAQALA